MAQKRKVKPIAGGDPLWYKDAIFYQMRIASFADSDGDGIGDFRGAIEKLDYLQDLGVNVVWMLPFYPSPGRDDGYDIADYMSVRPELGTLDDFQEFMHQAHQRNLRVMTELVINHTSDQHAWFQRARKAPKGSPERDFYVWSDDKDKYGDVRIIFQDFETSNWSWDAVAGQFYWHRFFHHQPDLNFDNPAVHEAVFDAFDFWLGMGVDGLRLDAIPYLYEREGTNGENLPETHAFLKKLRARVDATYPNRVLLAEANQWPEDSVEYFGDGDECQMAFHFPIMPRLYLALRTEDRYPVTDILRMTPDIPENCQWAIFLRNHDELTLEMVTDEERDIMRRAYAPDKQMRINLGIRRRLAPLLNNDRKALELMNGLIFSLPGTPIIYYGDEIGMGDNVYLGDRNGVRTPMQWSPDRNAGFSRANPQRLFLPVITDPAYHFEAINVEVQQSNPHSLLWWMKRIMALRRRYKAFGRGSVEFLQPQNTKILSFIRRYKDEDVDETILVIVNLSRFTQSVEIDLSTYKGMTPVEMFGATPFPEIRDTPYTFTMGPHNFFWFELTPMAEGLSVDGEGAERATLQVAGEWLTLFDVNNRADLEEALPAYILPRRWYQSKARRLKRVHIEDVIPVGQELGMLIIARLTYKDGDDEIYMLPMSYAAGDTAVGVLSQMPSMVIADLICQVEGSMQNCLLYDASADPNFTRALLDVIWRAKPLKGARGKVTISTLPAFKEMWDGKTPLTPSVYSFEQSNTSIRYGEDLFLKLMRKVTPGVNPELEIGRYFASHATEVNVPKLVGALEYVRSGEEPQTLAVLQNYTPNQGDAWRYTLNWLGRFLETRLTETDALPEMPTEGVIALAGKPVPAAVELLMGGYLDEAQLLGQRTAEMHAALATDRVDAAFKPEPFGTLYQRSLYQSMYNLTNRIFRQLRAKRKGLSGDLAAQVDTLLGMEDRIINAFKSITARKLSGSLIRVHGDYHLGQVLHTGNDFVIIDFQGEPGRSLAERRLKRSPMRDVAGMLRSFDYASYAALPGYGMQNIGRIEDLPTLEPWSRLWCAYASAAYLDGYFKTAQSAGFLPKSEADMEIVLRTLLLEKAVYEIGYELNNRPSWLRVPVAAVLERVAEWEMA